MANSAQIWEDYLLNFQASGGALSVNVNGGSYTSVSGAIGGYQTVVRQQLAILPQAAAVRIDNPTPFLVYLPEQNVQVGPGVTGYYVVFPVPITNVDVQIQWIANTPVQSFAGQGGGLNTVIRYYQHADGPPTGGSTQAQGVAVFDQDYSFHFISSPFAAQLFSNAPNGKHVVGGYDSGTGDGATVPARTPNVVFVSSFTLAAGDNVFPLYTPPVGKSWWLQYLQVSIDNAGAVLPVSRYLMRVFDNGVEKLTYQYLPQDTAKLGAAQLFSFPGAGLKASAANANFGVRVFADVGGASLIGRAVAALYVGPP